MNAEGALGPGAAIFAENEPFCERCPRPAPWDRIRRHSWHAKFPPVHELPTRERVPGFSRHRTARDPKRTKLRRKRRIGPPAGYARLPVPPPTSPRYEDRIALQFSRYDPGQ